MEILLKKKRGFQIIYNEYIKSKSTSEVPIPQQIRNQIERISSNLNLLNSTTLNTAQHEVYVKMKREFHVMFLNDSSFLEAFVIFIFIIY